MTPVNISQFSEALKQQMSLARSSFDLSSSAPIFVMTHPALLKLEFESNIHSAPTQVHGFYFSSCRATHAGTRKGYPHEIYQFIHRPQEMVVDFGTLGLAKIGPSPIAESESDPKLATWLSYALSPELWGAEGKWTRFHQRLHGLFTKFDLLVEEDVPGFYALNEKAKRLEKHGFRGEINTKGLLFILPWDFSLSDLHQLERAAELEF